MPFLSCKLLHWWVYDPQSDEYICHDCDAFATVAWLRFNKRIAPFHPEGFRPRYIPQKPAR